MSKKMKVIFTVSCLANVLLFGLVGGHVLKCFYDKKGDDLLEMQAQLSPEGQHIVSKKMQSVFQEMRPKMKQTRQAKKNLEEVLQAEDFDAERFETLARNMADLNVEFLERRIVVTKDLASQLSVDDRRLLAKHFARGFSSGRPRDARKDGKRNARAVQKASMKKAEGLHPFLDGVSNDVSGKTINPPDMPEDMPPQP